MAAKGLVERLENKEVVLAAEGYLLELARRGYQSLGSFVPIVCADDPDKVEELAREFAFSGSDITQAFTYYAHRKKMADLGRGEDFEKLNRNAFALAKKVAKETNTLFCAGLGTMNIYDPADPETSVETENLFREQVSLAKEFEVDYIAVETMWDYGEASIGLKVCKDFDIPAVITVAPLDDKVLFDGVPLMEALVKLENEGAAAVGFNCARGPKTMIPLIREARKHVKGALACLCLGYRTSEEEPNWYNLHHPCTNQKVFPEDLCAFQLSPSEVRWFGEQCKEIGVAYLGLCCGNEPRYMRTLCEVFDRKPPSYKYRCDFMELSSMTEKTEGSTYSAARYRIDWPKFSGMSKE